MSGNIDRLQNIFNRANMSRNNIRYKLNRTLYDHVSFMENKIRKQLKTFTLLSICGGQRSNYVVNSHFQSAFTALTLEQKVLYFEKTIIYIRRFEQEKQNNKITTEAAQLQQIQKKYGQQVRVIIEVNSGFSSWDQQTISISGFKINSTKKVNVDLRNYLIRKSKKKQVNCHVLQAIRASKPQTIRFCFKLKQEEQKYIGMINQLINAAYYDFIRRQSFNMEVGIMKKNPKTGKSMISLEQKSAPIVKKTNLHVEKDNQLSFDKENEDVAIKRSHSISVSYQLMRTKDEQQIQEDLQDLIDQENQRNSMPYPSTSSLARSQKKIRLEKKNYLNVLNIMLPSYNLHQLDSLHNYEPVPQTESDIFIFKNRHNHHRFKMEMTFNLPPKVVLMILYNVQIYKSWHPSVNQGQQKFRISTQNCSIFYQKHSTYSQWYRQRDFLFLKHVFLLKNSYYLIDKSFQNTNFVPFKSIQRGRINHCVTRISETQKGSSLIMDIDIDHGGLLKETYQQQLTLNYLKGFKNLQAHFSRSLCLSKLATYFYHDWDISQTLNNQSQFTNVDNLRTEDFEQASEIASKQIDQSQLYFSVDDLDGNENQDVLSEHEIRQEQILQKQEHMKQTWNLPSKIELDQNGLIVVSQKYIRKRHIVEITPAGQQKVRIQKKFEHIILQDNFKHVPEGGLQIINQKKIQAQNNVFGFILKKLRQNIFSGKGLTNISLPVEIFNCDSNLSRMCRGFALAPQFLEKAAKSRDPIVRMKFSMLFGLSSSMFYLDAEKPFNPILGQTYQGVIDGCPVYAEQISHHPPITSFYMLGRGYKIYGGVEAKVNLHINSADGLNEGFYHIQFDDGQKISFTTPPGQMSNTTMGGNRKFNFLGKGSYFDVKNRLYSDLKFQQETGMFSKGKWKCRDQIQGQILRVKQQFMSKVFTRVKQKKSPTDKQIQERYNKLSGRWLLQVYWDNQSFYRPNQILPFELKNYDYPLPSDCFYREDIYYRIMQDLARSQIEKQRLQVFQRGDRKFREKYHKPTH